MGAPTPTPQEVGKKWEVQRPKLYMGCYLMFRFRFDHQFFLPVCIVIHWRKSKHILEMHELLCLFHFISLCFVSCLFSCSLRFTSSWRGEFDGQPVGLNLKCPTCNLILFVESKSACLWSRGHSSGQEILRSTTFAFLFSRALIVKQSWLCFHFPLFWV